MEVRWRDFLTEKPDLSIHGVSRELQVYTSRGRVLSGYWDDRRGKWMISNLLPPEKVERWTDLLETIE